MKQQISQQNKPKLNVILKRVNRKSYSLVIITFAFLVIISLHHVFISLFIMEFMSMSRRLRVIACHDTLVVVVTEDELKPVPIADVRDSLC